MTIALVWTGVAALLVPLGYGSDVDAWLVGERARQIWESGTYLRSRSTGFPLYELSVTPFVHMGGWLASNIYTALWGLLLLWLLFRLAARGELRHAAVTTITFLFLPVVVKNATSTMDYIPAIALLTGSYVALTEKRYVLSAVLIGVACGFRPSSGLWIVPTVVWVLVDPSFHSAGRKYHPWWIASGMSAVAVLVGTAAFWPSLRLGTNFAIAPVTTIANGVLNGMRMFGIGQTLVLACLTAAILWHARQCVCSQRERPFVAFHATNTLVWLAFFMLLPGEPEYLMPVILSCILVLDRYAGRGAMITAALVLLSFHVVALEVNGSRGGTQPRGVMITSGFTVRDVNDRRFKLWLREAANRETLPDSNDPRPVLFMEQIMPPVVGRPGWTFDEPLGIERRGDNRVAVSQRITDVESLRALHDAGYRITAWQQYEWEYDQPAFQQARPFVEFVNDPGTLFGVPVRGLPF
ncbi:MAG: hypothetical protein LBQ09_12855 [Acidobacteriaceae bacterium]|jgi:hypothetical protein|nr:hypothetical protein [Acidobacteriaceae bacterium]